MFAPLGVLLARVWAVAEGQRHRFAYGALFLAAQVLLLGEPFVIGRMLDAAQLTATDPSAAREIARWALVYFSLQIGFWILHGPGRVIESMTAFDLQGHHRLSLFRRVIDLPMAWHREHHSGETLSRVGRSTQALRSFADSGFSLFYMLTRLAGALMVLLWLMPAAGLFGLVMSVTCLFLTSRLDGWLTRVHRSVMTLEDRIATGLQDYLGNVVTLLNLRLETRALAEMQARVTAPRELLRRAAAINELKWFTMNLFMAAMVTGGVLLHVAHEVGAGRALGAGALFALVEYLRRAGSCFLDFGGLYTGLVEQAVAITSADPVVEAHRSLRGTAPAAPPLDLTGWTEIRLENLGFRYASGPESPALDVTSLTVRRGRSMALIGASGSGKSTLLRVLRGLEIAGSLTVIREGRPPATCPGALDLGATLLPRTPRSSRTRCATTSPSAWKRTSPACGKPSTWPVSRRCSAACPQGSTRIWPSEAST